MKIIVLDEYIKNIESEENILNGSFTKYANDLEHARTLISENMFDIFFFDSNKYGIDGIHFLTDIPKKNFPLFLVNTSTNDLEVDTLIINLCNLSGSKKTITRDKKLCNLHDIKTIIDDIKKVYISYNIENNNSIDINSEEDYILDILNEGEFVNYYQPQYHKDINNPVSVEALVRYIHPRLGVIPPSIFLHLVDVDYLFWGVIKRALIDLEKLPNEIKLSINVNQRTLQKPVSKELLDLCSSHGFLPSRLTLELTEDEAFDGGIVSLANVIAIRMAGIGLAIDDFGTGHSSLSQLVSLPFSELKVDQKFIKNIRDSYKNQEVLKISMLLAKSLNMSIIAEGIEDIETLQYLKNVGVNYYQGYLFGHPMPLQELKNTFK
ncbi:TPA: EAL domain-containing protein [Vibrio harveyi]|nr:EAL domain-containing protein [Vibrio harveyi]